MLWATDVCSRAVLLSLGRSLRPHWAGFSQLMYDKVSWVMGFVCHLGLVPGFARTASLAPLVPALGPSPRP